jgi:hypothetical protein
MITIDTKDAQNKLSELTAQLTAAEIRKATSRAINHTLNKARTASATEIRKRYNMKASDAKRSMSIRKAHISNQTGYLSASSAVTPLHQFNPRQTTNSGVTTSRTSKGWRSRKGRAPKSGGGVTIQIIRGRRIRIPSAFIVFSSGISGIVMARGKYQDQSFAFRRGRGSRVRSSGNDNPISSLVSVSVFSASIDSNVQERMSPQITEAYNERIAHEMSVIIRKIVD